MLKSRDIWWRVVENRLLLGSSPEDAVAAANHVTKAFEDRFKDHEDAERLSKSFDQMREEAQHFGLEPQQVRKGGYI